MKRVTKMSMVGAFWLCKWEEASSIPYGIEATPFWGSHIDGSNNSEEAFPGVHRRAIFAPKFGWTSSSFREDVLRMTLLIAMRLNFWDVPKVLIPKSMVSIRKMHQFVMFCFGTSALKKTSIEPQIYHHQCENSQGKFWDQQASGRCQTLSRPSRLVHKK